MKHTIFLVFLIWFSSSCTYNKQTPNTLAIDTKMYPNPVDDQLFLDYNIYNPGIITFFTVNGIQIHQTPLPTGNGSHSISMVNVPNGTYFYKIFFSINDTATGKLLVSH
jgi:hypothetical protein